MTIPRNKVTPSTHDTYNRSKIDEVKEPYVNSIPPICQRCKKVIDWNTKFYSEEDGEYHEECS